MHWYKRNCMIWSINNEKDALVVVQCHYWSSKVLFQIINHIIQNKLDSFWCTGKIVFVTLKMKMMHWYVPSRINGARGLQKIVGNSFDALVDIFGGGQRSDVLILWFILKMRFSENVWVYFFYDLYTTALELNPFILGRSKLY